MNRAVQIVLIVIIVIAMVGMGTFLLTRPAADREVLYQVGSLSELEKSRLDGYWPVSILLEHGDIGMGTFNALDGEMIVIDGKCYKASSDGTVAQVSSNELTPFAQVTFFDEDGSEPIQGSMNMSEVESLMTDALPSQTVFYILRIDGTFDEITVRSVP